LSFDTAAVILLLRTSLVSRLLSIGTMLTEEPIFLGYCAMPGTGCNPMENQSNMQPVIFSYAWKKRGSLSSLHAYGQTITERSTPLRRFHSLPRNHVVDLRVITKNCAYDSYLLHTGTYGTI
jgi:hypothetical protein